MHWQALQRYSLFDKMLYTLIKTWALGALLLSVRQNIVYLDKDLGPKLSSAAPGPTRMVHESEKVPDGNQLPVRQKWCINPEKPGA